MVDVISCRYRMEGRWFIALSPATSRTFALACRMNTALSVLSIRHHHLHPPLPPLHTLPFHATIHKLSFIILIPFPHICYLHATPGPPSITLMHSIVWQFHIKTICFLPHFDITGHLFAHLTDWMFGKPNLSFLLSTGSSHLRSK